MNLVTKTKKICILTFERFQLNLIPGDDMMSLLRPKMKDDVQVSPTAASDIAQVGEKSWGAAKDLEFGHHLAFRCMI